MGLAFFFEGSKTEEFSGHLTVTEVHPGGRRHWHHEDQVAFPSCAHCRGVVQLVHVHDGGVPRTRKLIHIGAAVRFERCRCVVFVGTCNAFDEAVPREGAAGWSGVTNRKPM